MIVLNSISIFNLPFSWYFENQGINFSADDISKITSQNEMKFFKKIKITEHAEYFFEIQTEVFFQISFIVSFLYSAN